MQKSQTKAFHAAHCSLSLCFFSTIQSVVIQPCCGESNEAVILCLQDGLSGCEITRKTQCASLQAAVGDGKAGIPRNQIFPMFKELAAAHQATVACLQKAECLPRLWACLQSHVGRWPSQTHICSKMDMVANASNSPCMQLRTGKGCAAPDPSEADQCAMQGKHSICPSVRIWQLSMLSSGSLALYMPDAYLAGCRESYQLMTVT